MTLDDMRSNGFIAPVEPVGNPLGVWSLFDFRHVRWDLLPTALPTWCGMYVVVAFSSSLDVAAIQMDMGRQLDFNHELVTVGISNLLSGLTGGDCHALTHCHHPVPSRNALTECPHAVP